MPILILSSMSWRKKKPFQTHDQLKQRQTTARRDRGAPAPIKSRHLSILNPSLPFLFVILLPREVRMQQSAVWWCCGSSRSGEGHPSCECGVRLPTLRTPTPQDTSIEHSSPQKSVLREAPVYTSHPNPCSPLILFQLRVHQRAELQARLHCTRAGEVAGKGGQAHNTRGHSQA